MKELRIKSFGPTVVRLREIGVNCATTTGSCEEIVGTYAETGAISGVTGVMRGEAEGRLSEVYR